jgi:phage baseplate assembly protein W
MADESFESLLRSKKIKLSSTDFKDELLLERSVYNTNAVRKDLEALAQTIQNLLIIEPGTYPNQPSLGVGIENYQFEFLDDRTLSEIREKTDSQIEKFIPTSLNIEMEIDTIKNNLGQNILYFSFYVSDDNRFTKPENITILFANNKNNKKIISKIIL